VCLWNATVGRVKSYVIYFDPSTSVIILSTLAAIRPIGLALTRSVVADVVTLSHSRGCDWWSHLFCCSGSNVEQPSTSGDGIAIIYSFLGGAWRREYLLELQWRVFSCFYSHIFLFLYGQFHAYTVSSLLHGSTRIYIEALYKLSLIIIIMIVVLLFSE